MSRLHRAGAAALQHVNANRRLRNDVLKLIAVDIIGDSRTDAGHESMDYWHICVLVCMSPCGSAAKLLRRQLKGEVSGLRRYRLVIARDEARSARQLIAMRAE